MLLAVIAKQTATICSLVLVYSQTSPLPGALELLSVSNVKMPTHFSTSKPDTAITNYVSTFCQ